MLRLRGKSRAVHCISRTESVEAHVPMKEPRRGTRGRVALVSSGSCLVLAAILVLPAEGAYFSCGQSSGTGQQPGDQKQETAGATQTGSTFARGKKLILKDGTYQIVRTYERKGERVRYLSAERGDWEELPASMVDWEATAKAEATAERESEELVEKVKKREAAEKVETALDIDASLEVGPGVFLPPGEGMFVIEGKAVTPLEQVETRIKLDKGRLIEQVLVPVPVVPSRHRVEIPGARAKLRVSTAQPEFYLREAPPDPERTTPIQKSSRPGESGPEVELIRAKVKGGNRQLEWISTSVVGEQRSKRDSISIERWPMAPNVFRFTISQPLEPGEYALAEILPDGMNLYVWEFGIDGGTGAAGRKPQPSRASKARQ